MSKLTNSNVLLPNSFAKLKHLAISVHADQQFEHQPMCDPTATVPHPLNSSNCSLELEYIINQTRHQQLEMNGVPFGETSNDSKNFAD